MKKFGIAAILSFVDKGATRAMGKVGAMAKVLQKRFKGIGAGAKQISSGLGQMTMAMMPVALGFGFMIRDGMKFQQAMAGLKAVLLDTTGEGTAGLKSLAKTMGATTVFSASEAAEAMTNLSRAGFEANEVASAIPGTLAAAAAEGISLATAADMVASNVRAFGLEAGKAGEVAGSMALVSARTNTNMVSLQEGMKLAAPIAKKAGFSFKETALALGSLADIGLKGTLSGTALRSAITNLLSPTKKVLKAMGGRAGLNSVIRENDGSLRGLSDIMFRVNKKLGKVKDKITRTDIAMKIFGKRGIAVTSAFDKSGLSLEKFIEKEKELRLETGNTAKVMAALQLNTLGGQFKLVRSAIESVNIELFGMISGQLRGGVKNLAGDIGKLALALRVVRGEKIVDKETLKQIKALPKNFIEMAKGIKQGFKEAKQVLKDFWNTAKKVLRFFGIGVENDTKGTAKLITKIVVLTAAFAPLGLAVLGVTRFFGGLASAAIGAGKVMFHTLGLAGSVVKAMGGGVAASVKGTAGFGGAALGLTAAATAGFAVGTAFDKIFGISDKLGPALFRLFNTADAAGKKAKAKEGAKSSAVVQAQRMLETFAKLSQSGITKVGTKGNKSALTREFATQKITAYLKSQKLSQAEIATALSRMATTFNGIKTPASTNVKPLKTARDAMVSSGGMIPVSAGDVVMDRASLATAVVSQMRGGLAGRAGGGALGGGDPGRVSPAPATSSGPIQINTSIQVDGREIAIAVAKVQLDELERNGSNMNPGDRSNLLERGFLGGM